MLTLTFLSGVKVQVYVSELSVKNGCLSLDLDCVLRIGQVFTGWKGFGFRLFGFGFGVAWPASQEAIQHWFWANTVWANAHKD